MEAQLAANAVITGSEAALFGLSYTLLRQVNGFFDLSPAGTAIIGAYVATLVPGCLGAQVVAALLCGVVAALAAQSAIGSRRMLRAGSSLRFLATLGGVTALQAIVAMLWGDSAREIFVPLVAISLGAARGTSLQLSVALAAFSAWLCLVAVRSSRAGLTYRAVVADPSLALVAGLAVDRIRYGAAAVSGALGGLAGFFVGVQVGATPGLGLRGVFLGVVVAVLGGNRIGAVLPVGLALGALRAATGWWLGSVWQEAVTYVVLLLSLLGTPSSAQSDGRRSD